jgi:hypothetical protein
LLLGRKNRNSVSVSVSPCVADEGKSKHLRASQAKKTVIDKFSFQGTHCYDSFCVQKCALCDEQLHKVVNAKHWVIHRGMDGEYYVENNSAIIIFIVLFVWQLICEFVLFTVAQSPSYPSVIDCWFGVTPLLHCGGLDREFVCFREACFSFPLTGDTQN